MSIILDIKDIEVSIDEHSILQHITLPITEYAYGYYWAVWLW